MITAVQSSVSYVSVEHVSQEGWNGEVKKCLIDNRISSEIKGNICLTAVELVGLITHGHCGAADNNNNTTSTE
jgi:hypothetical protein